MVYTIVQLEQTCVACPAQWSGKLDDGREVYIRYRWGCLTARVEDDEVFDECVGDGLAGYLDYSQMQDYLGRIFNFP